MTEEQVTRILIAWLMENGWEIICFDFPQSGTGRLLHPNNSNSKNKNAINPDIVAVRQNKCIFLENKSYFYFPDFEKVNMLRQTDLYSNAISDLLKGYSIRTTMYGIGYPTSAHKIKAKQSLEMVDFVLGVNEDGSISVLYEVAEGVFGGR